MNTLQHDKNEIKDKIKTPKGQQASQPIRTRVADWRRVHSGKNKLL